VRGHKGGKRIVSGDKNNLGKKRKLPRLKQVGLSASPGEKRGGEGWRSGVGHSAQIGRDTLTGKKMKEGDGKRLVEHRVETGGSN